MQCSFVKSDGSRCGANALGSSTFCYFHDPAVADERAAARVRGGRNRRPGTLPADGPDFNLQSADDVVQMLERSVNEVARGRLDRRVANSVGFLAATLLKAIEVAGIERRVADIESRLNESSACASACASHADRLHADRGTNGK